MNIFNIILIVLVLFILWLIITYNSLIRSKNRVKEAFSDIDVQLKRRFDLIPNLVEAVKGYMQHEKTVLENITAARSAIINAGSDIHKKVEAENMLSGALKTLFAVAENYPQLKASENFLKLQDELSDTENKIQAARRFYNVNVRDFNTLIQTFPTNLIANIMNFEPFEFFEAESEEKENIKVSF
ncbi:MAG: LemA family protein [bacterium]|nr:LemA family protein [Patescibacteria group bacterium]MDW8279560.1 LemA family protein [bacterium]